MIESRPPRPHDEQEFHDFSHDEHDSFKPAQPQQRPQAGQNVNQFRASLSQPPRASFKPVEEEPLSAAIRPTQQSFSQLFAFDDNEPARPTSARVTEPTTVVDYHDVTEDEFATSNLTDDFTEYEDEGASPSFIHFITRHVYSH